MTDDRKTQDARFADEFFATLASTPVPPGLEARILADFDRIAARRVSGVTSRLMNGWWDAIWPGVPAWKPASVLALSLAIGLTAGVLVPLSELTASTTSTDQQILAAGDAPPVVSMAGDL
jgi:hypothetical protein